VSCHDFGSRLCLHDLAITEYALPARERVENAVTTEDCAGAEDRVAADFSPVTDDRPEFSKTGVEVAGRAFDADIFAVEADVGANHPCAEVGFVAEDGVAHVVEMRHLTAVEKEAVFELRRVSKGAPFANDDIFADVSATADRGAFADPGRAFDDRVGLDRRAGGEVDPFTDHGTRVHISLNEIALDGIESRGEIGVDLRNRRPNRRIGRKERSVIGLIKVEEIGGWEHGRFNYGDWRGFANISSKLARSEG